MSGVTNAALSSAPNPLAPDEAVAKLHIDMTDPQIVFAFAGLILAATIAAALRSVNPATALPDAQPLDWTGGHRRRRDAKCFNERLKLGSTLFNNFGIAVVIAAFVAPAVRGEALPSALDTGLALIVLGLLHISAQVILRFWRSEE